VSSVELRVVEKVHYLVAWKVASTDTTKVVLKAELTVVLRAVRWGVQWAAMMVVRMAGLTAIQLVAQRAGNLALMRAV
jgi:hypothetical protein